MDEGRGGWVSEGGGKTYEAAHVPPRVAGHGTEVMETGEVAVGPVEI